MSHQKNSSIQDEIAKHAERCIRRIRHNDFLTYREFTLNLASEKERETYLPAFRNLHDIKCLIEKKRAHHNRICSYIHWCKLKQQRERY